MASLFSKTRMPPIPEPTPMPTPDDAQAIAARRRGVARASKKSGALSTILSAGTRETLGG